MTEKEHCKCGALATRYGGGARRDFCERHWEEYLALRCEAYISSSTPSHPPMCSRSKAQSVQTIFGLMRLCSQHVRSYRNRRWIAPAASTMAEQQEKQ